MSRILRIIGAVCLLAVLLFVAHQSRQERKAVQRMARAVERMTARPLNDARVQLIAPQLDATDRALLTFDEIDTLPLDVTYSAQDWPREVSWPEKAADADAPYARYVDRRWREVVTDATLAAPEIHVEPGLYPLISMPEMFDDEGREAVYYFEFDTVPTFDGPNLWRYPALAVAEYPDDITDRHGLKFRLLATPLRNVDGRENEIRFPFRVTAMRLPGWDGLAFAEMQKQARALAFGLDGEAAIREVYAYTRQVYNWASDTRYRNPIDTFAAGLGECGHVNDLAGALLEMNGIRYRGVSGHSPKGRALTRGNAGHSAIEVLNPETGRWGYMDPYMDILRLDVQARDLRKTELGGMVVSRIGDYAMTLGDLFSYRDYFDKLGRARSASMLRLADSDAYGKGWPLNVAPEFDAAELWPHPIRVHVRARYAFADGEAVQWLRAPRKAHPEIRLSQWAETSFEISPRGLLAD